MAIILGLDFETTGTNPHAEGFEVIEVGAALLNGLTGQLIEMHSWLISTNVDIPDSVMKLTGLDNRILALEGHHLKIVDEELSYLIQRADYLCAHNHGYEKAVLELFLGLAWGKAESKQWIDTMTDLPNGVGNSNLTTVAANHRFINPFPHRALPDVLIMLAVLAQYDFAEVERNVLAESVELSIYIPFNGGEESREQAKALGYRWNPERKIWVKTVKAFQMDGELEKAHSVALFPAIPAGIPL